MVEAVTTLVFAGAFAMATSVIGASIAPQWQRIVRLASGRADMPFAPLAHLTMVERRIAVRRWASLPAQPAIWTTREAA